MAKQVVEGRGAMLGLIPEMIPISGYIFEVVESSSQTSGRSAPHSSAEAGRLIRHRYQRTGKSAMSENCWMARKRTNRRLEEAR